MSVTTVLTTISKKTSTQVTKTAQCRLASPGSSSHPPAGEHVRGHVVKGNAKIHSLTAAAQRHEKVEIRAMSASTGPQVAHTSGGYNANHSNYEAARIHSRNRAMTCQVAVGDIPLLNIVFNGIMESYQCAIGDLLRSRGVLLSADDVLFPLSVADVEMVDVNGVPYTMDFESNVIRAHFFKSNKDGNSLVYNPRAKPVVVQLQLRPTWYSMYVEWINDLEQKQLERDEAAEFGAKPVHPGGVIHHLLLGEIRHHASGSLARDAA
ncbi:hypothetical protein GGX14DRAFT_402531 [Mycena pura]|uniref:Uncharacterized protein n=1 Tax=Mycena pura TaxID=153505 RepID=A0AAD6V1Z1_9AGAR|nr:hypothetical protein GGX14DRAFT_402531 [Mycena pura]